MKFVYLLLMLVGLGAYVMAFLDLDSPDNVIYFHIGHAILLFDVTLMLVIDHLENREPNP